jgi:hypothetical protein
MISGSKRRTGVLVGQAVFWNARWCAMCCAADGGARRKQPASRHELLRLIGHAELRLRLMVQMFGRESLVSPAIMAELWNIAASRCFERAASALDRSFAAASSAMVRPATVAPREAMSPARGTAPGAPQRRVMG